MAAERRKVKGISSDLQVNRNGRATVQSKLGLGMTENGGSFSRAAVFLRLKIYQHPPVNGEGGVVALLILSDMVFSDEDFLQVPPSCNFDPAFA